MASDEQYLPKLRRRIVQECGGDPDWENESIYQHEALDMKRDGVHPSIVIKEPL